MASFQAATSIIATILFRIKMEIKQKVKYNSGLDKVEAYLFFLSKSLDRQIKGQYITPLCQRLSKIQGHHTAIPAVWLLPS